MVIINSNVKEFLGISVSIIILFLIYSGVTLLYKNNGNDIISEKFKIYSKNINTDKEIIVEEFEFSDDINTIDNKLNVVARKLSDSMFKGLPIELIQIKEVEDKMIAIFNLKENEDNLVVSDWSKYSEPNWANNFFQGSAGGSWTCYTLQTTMLQPDYEGEWIDGVKFLYNGEENIYFQHIEGLDKIKYR